MNVQFFEQLYYSEYYNCYIVLTTYQLFFRRSTQFSNILRRFCVIQHTIHIPPVGPNVKKNLKNFREKEKHAFYIHLSENSSVTFSHKSICMKNENGLKSFPRFCLHRKIPMGKVLHKTRICS